MLFCLYLSGSLFISIPGPHSPTINAQHISVIQDQGGRMGMSFVGGTDWLWFDKDPDVTAVDLLRDCEAQAEYDILEAYQE